MKWYVQFKLLIIEKKMWFKFNYIKYVLPHNLYHVNLIGI